MMDFSNEDNEVEDTASGGSMFHIRIVSGKMTFEIGGLWPFDKRTAWIHNVVPLGLVVHLGNQ